jgi:hypothetical protein
VGDAGSGRARGRWDPEVGGACVENDLEGLGGGAEGDWAVVLGRHCVG